MREHLCLLVLLLIFYPPAVSGMNQTTAVSFGANTPGGTLCKTLSYPNNFVFPATPSFTFRGGTGAFICTTIPCTFNDKGYTGAGFPDTFNFTLTSATNSQYQMCMTRIEAACVGCGWGQDLQLFLNATYICPNGLCEWGNTCYPCPPAGSTSALMTFGSSQTQTLCKTTLYPNNWVFPAAPTMIFLVGSNGVYTCTTYPCSFNDRGYTSTFSDTFTWKVQNVQPNQYDMCVTRIDAGTSWGQNLLYYASAYYQCPNSQCQWGYDCYTCPPSGQSTTVSLGASTTPTSCNTYTYVNNRIFAGVPSMVLLLGDHAHTCVTYPCTFTDRGYTSALNDMYTWLVQGVSQSQYQICATNTPWTQNLQFNIQAYYVCPDGQCESNGACVPCPVTFQCPSPIYMGSTVTCTGNLPANGAIPTFTSNMTNLVQIGTVSLDKTILSIPITASFVPKLIGSTVAISNGLFTVSVLVTALPPLVTLSCTSPTLYVTSARTTFNCTLTYLNIDQQTPFFTNYSAFGLSPPAATALLNFSLAWTPPLATNTSSLQFFLYADALLSGIAPTTPFSDISLNLTLNLPPSGTPQVVPIVIRDQLLPNGADASSDMWCGSVSVLPGQSLMCYFEPRLLYQASRMAAFFRLTYTDSTTRTPVSLVLGTGTPYWQDTAIGIRYYLNLTTPVTALCDAVMLLTELNTNVTRRILVVNAVEPDPYITPYRTGSAVLLASSVIRMPVNTSITFWVFPRAANRSLVLVDAALNFTEVQVTSSSLTTRPLGLTTVPTAVSGLFTVLNPGLSDAFQVSYTARITGALVLYDGISAQARVVSVYNEPDITSTWVCSPQILVIGATSQCTVTARVANALVYVLGDGWSVSDEDGAGTVGPRTLLTGLSALDLGTSFGFNYTRTTEGPVRITLSRKLLSWTYDIGFYQAADVTVSTFTYEDCN
eukprot:TRINITY_DN12558_c0_g1_i4.p1 TRINITY_DN12558_c0_g1~~TRINITY_DN12558_c0_g1_i4.p1  ORF type:complete len:936 (-),score=63.65 TRINITY_DN12558_c0_g1_i4:94-2901(-)